MRDQFAKSVEDVYGCAGLIAETRNGPIIIDAIAIGRKVPRKIENVDFFGRTSTAKFITHYNRVFASSNP